MEIVTQVPSGPTLHIENDRQFDSQTGDSVLRIQGERPEGGQVFDACYVEVEAQEAQAIALVLRSLATPQPEMIDHIAREIQSAFGSVLSGRDAHQVAEIGSRARFQMVQSWMGGLTLTQKGTQTPTQQQQVVEKLAQRFERAASKKVNPPTYLQGDEQFEEENGEGGGSSPRSRKRQQDNN